MGRKRHISETISLLVRRDGPNCYWCGTETIFSRKEHGESDPENKRTRDHLIPKSLGGSNSLDNLVIACLRCNTTRATIPVDAWLEAINIALLIPVSGEHPAVTAHKAIVGFRHE